MRRRAVRWIARHSPRIAWKNQISRSARSNAPHSLRCFTPSLGKRKMHVRPTLVHFATRARNTITSAATFFKEPRNVSRTTLIALWNRAFISAASHKCRFVFPIWLARSSRRPARYRQMRLEERRRPRERARGTTKEAFLDDNFKFSLPLIA